MLKSATIEAQQSVIRLQNDLLVCKDKQIENFQVFVQNAVQDSVKTGLKSYSEAVRKSIPKSTEIKSVKKAMQQVLKEEDCSRNCIIFGLAEEPAEETSSVLDGVMEFIGMKPKIQAVRIGVQKKVVAGNRPKPHPVKVSLPSSTHVQILREAKTLKDSEQYKNVFIAPDRTVEEHRLRRELVESLKKKRQDEPNQRHFIKGNEIVSSSGNT